MQSYICTWLPFGHYLICFNSWIFDFRISWTALAGWGGWTSLDCAGLDWTGAGWLGWLDSAGWDSWAGWLGWVGFLVAVGLLG